MKTHLKMKIKSLAAESRLIRYEEEHHWPAGHPMRASLQSHRVTVVRYEARCALLAYAFLRGRHYSQAESSCARAGMPDAERIAKLIRRFSWGYRNNAWSGVDKRVVEHWLASSSPALAEQLERPKAA